MIVHRRVRTKISKTTPCTVEARRAEAARSGSFKADGPVRQSKPVSERACLRCTNTLVHLRPGSRFRLPKLVHILIYQLNMKAAMTARAKKRTETSVRKVAAGSRRGMPRAATAASKIYSDLRIELVSLQRRPGEAISEAEIALSYGVSRTPVREAILKLSDEGLLEIYPQSGIFVSRIPVAALPEAIIIRKALEETTARLAAERATSSQILALRSVLERQREASAAKDSSAFHQADELFHATIAGVAGYPGIWKFIQQVKVHVDRYRRLTLPQQG